MAQNEDFRDGARHDNTREIELAKELYAPNGRKTDTETKQKDPKTKECLNDVQNEKVLTVLSQSSNECLRSLIKTERMHDHAC